MQFTRQEIIGNTALVDFLNKLVASDKLPTALLLVGPPMVGKTTIAENIAQKVVCTERAICGRCPGCTIGIINHPDVLRLGVSDEDSLRKGISNLLKRIHEKPVLGSKLIVFLDNIDEFSWAASPLLLKALEDAPSYVIFFMTAENMESVLPTIRSRAMVRSVGPASLGELSEKLVTEFSGKTRDDGKEGEGSSQNSPNDVNLVNQIVSLSGGRPGLAIRLLGDSALREKYRGWNATLANMSNLTLGERSQFAETIDKAGEGREVIVLLQSLLRNRIAREVVEKSGRVGEDKKFLGTMRRSREATAMLKANVPQRLVLEYVFFNQ